MIDEQEIQIAKLPPMRVVSAHAYGESPETAAFALLQRYAEDNGLLQDGELPPTFGFNNPNPSPGSPNYGYEVWLPVEEDVQSSGEIRPVAFEGGLYAVTRCRDLHNIGDAWLELARWREGTAYAPGKQQWLEHLLSPPDAPPEAFVIDLYLPIAE
jgi:DNA gyrase inhibitor GyrI